MFKPGSIIYFKNPLSFGRIANSDIGPRWCLSPDCEELETAPVFAAAAGILKSKFKVERIHDASEEFGVLVEVSSVDQPDLIAIVRPDYLIEDANPSTILNNNEKKLLLYLQSIVEPTELDVEFESKEEEEPKEKEAEHECSNCGKCSGGGGNTERRHKNQEDRLRDKAEQWDRTYSSHDGELEEACDAALREWVTELVSDILDKAVDRKLSEKLNKHRDSYPSPFDLYDFPEVIRIPVSRKVDSRPIRSIFDLF